MLRIDLFGASGDLKLIALRLEAHSDAAGTPVFKLYTIFFVSVMQDPHTNIESKRGPH